MNPIEFQRLVTYLEDFTAHAAGIPPEDAVADFNMDLPNYSLTALGRDLMEACSPQLKAQDNGS